MKENVTVIIPAYNEALHIEKTIKGIQTVELIDRIIVVDDGSKDETIDILSQLDIEYYKLEENRGKGYAINYALKKVLSNSKIIVFLDGDLGSSSSEVRKLIIPILNGEADVTIAKFLPAKKKGGFGLVKKLSQYGVYKFTGETISTTLSGQRAFKIHVLESIKTIPTDFGIEMGMTIDILRKGYKIKEVEVNMRHRETGRSLKDFLHRGRQFYQILKVILRKFLEVKLGD